MNSFVKKGLYCALIVGGLSLLGVGAANAAESSGEDGLLSGDQLGISLEAPLAIGGNALSVIGDSISVDSTASAPEAPAEPESEMPSSGSDGAATGDQIVVEAYSQAESTAPEESEAATTNGDDSLLGGNQILPDIDLPVTVGGNAISVIGDSTSVNSTTESTTPGDGEQGDAGTTNGDDSLLGGNQVLPDIDVPVTVGGNAISVIGDSTSVNSTTESTTPGDGEQGEADNTGAWTDGDDSLLGGNQVLPDIDAPVTVGGNAISVIGDSTSVNSTTESTTPGDSEQGDANNTGAWTDGDDSLLGGNQVLPDVDIPVTVGGNAISVIGDSTSVNSTTESTTPGDSEQGDASTTDGDDSLLGGNQVLPNVDIPVTVGGNAISVIGDSTTVDSTIPATPVNPTEPGEPGDPTDPTDPGEPTDPVIPVTPVTPVTPGNASPAANSSPIAMANASTETLAQTGMETLPLLALIALFPLAGLMLLVAARRRSATS